MNDLLPISLSPEHVLFRNQIFNSIDKCKLGYITMQGFVDILAKQSEYDFLFKDIRVLENAYRVIKMI